MRRWRVAIETALTVVVIVVLKLAIEALSLDFIALSPLYTSVVAGGIFVIGLLVAGTLADYKEAEKMPADIAAALENIHEDGACIKQAKEEFDLEGLQQSLSRVIATFRDDLATTGSRACLGAVNELSASFVELERLDVPPNYIVRLRTEQGVIRKSLLRIYHMQRTAFLPSAYVLIQSIVGLIVAALLFTELDPLYESIVVLIFISYFFIYLVKLLRVIDTPFRVAEHTMDDVSLFLLTELDHRLDEGRQGGKP